MADVQYSQLWGSTDRRWSPRLPDFSFAGYHFGEVSPPHVKQVADVKQFGAVGDGVADDSQAFLDAIAKTHNGAIFIPPGRYLIRQILTIAKSNLVLRGAGRDKSVLVFDKPLEHIRPDMAATTEGRPTSNYSWSGGFIWVRGKKLPPGGKKITSEARRFEQSFTVEDASPFKVGQRVRVQVSDDAAHTLIDHIYCGDTGPIQKMRQPARTDTVSRIAAIEGNRITLERPLRFDLREAWLPTISAFEPTVSEVGIEDLGFAFPDVPYEGHFTELGYNAIAFNACADCWCRDIRITNADSGIYLSGHFCSARNILIDCVRKDFQGDTGHHGVTMGTDCLIEDFDFQTRFIHDFSVDHWHTGNVVKNGRGVDLSFDHHRDGPYMNLFTNIDAGAGQSLWRCGGGKDLGKHTGAYATFWNIRARKPLAWPREMFGPPMMNLVGLSTDQPSQLDLNGRWFEAIDPAKLHPQDLHGAQLAYRLRR